MTTDSQLPRPADGSPAGHGAAPTGKEPSDKAPSRAELQAEVERTRAELGATIDALTTQLTVGYQAKRASRAAREAAADAGTLLTGGGLPVEDARRTRNVKALLGSIAVVAAVVAVAVTRRAVARGSRGV